MIRLKLKLVRYGSNRERHLLQKYGISVSSFKQLLKSQGNRCAICRIGVSRHYKKFVVDHNHKTQKIRGILCHKCNLTLGLVNDNVGILLSMIYYLKGAI